MESEKNVPEGEKKEEQASSYPVNSLQLKRRMSKVLKKKEKETEIYKKENNKSLT